MAIVGAGMFGVLALKTCVYLFGIDGFTAVGEMADMSDRKTLNAVRYIQIFSSIGSFIFPCVVQLVFMREPIVEGLGIRNKVSPIMIVLSILLVAFMQPAVSFIMEWSLSWQFPASMAETEATLRKMHDSAVAAQFAFLKNQNALDFIFNLFMMALLPAFAEELFFRRVGLRLLYDMTGNVHVAIFVSAFLFALVHSQFFYILPLFLFGLVLGYLALWSRSLWLPVIAHFINNAISLSIVYFVGDEVNDPSRLNPDFGAPVVSFIVSILLSLTILLLLKRRQVAE